MKLTYMRLLADDFKTSLQFYREMLGFPLVGGKEEWEYVELDAGGSTLLAIMPLKEMAEAIGAGEWLPEGQGRDRALLVFEVENVDAAAQDCRRRALRWLRRCRTVRIGEYEPPTSAIRTATSSKSIVSLPVRWFAPPDTLMPAI